MARKATGQVIEPNGKQRSWAIRFTAYGKRRFVSLGRPEEGWNRQRAEAELRHVLADVERGIWQPHRPDLVEAPREIPTFHEFASEWFEHMSQTSLEVPQAETIFTDYRYPPVKRKASAQSNQPGSVPGMIGPGAAPVGPNVPGLNPPKNAPRKKGPG